jgi:hypothetical protein
MRAGQQRRSQESVRGKDCSRACHLGTQDTEAHTRRRELLHHLVLLQVDRFRSPSIRHANSPPDGSSSSGAKGPSATGDGLLAGPAFPDTDSLALDSVLAAEGACVPRVLADFDLLHLTTQRGTVTGSVLAGDTDFHSALGL